MNSDSEQSSSDDASMSDIRRLISETQADNIQRMEDMRRNQMQYFDKVATAFEHNINEKFDGPSREVSLVTQRVNNTDKVVIEHTAQIDDILK